LSDFFFSGRLYSEKRRDGMAEEGFGERLKRLRSTKALTQEALGVAAGLRKSHISMLESGEREGGQLAVDAALALSDALGVSVEYLIRGKERPRPRPRRKRQPAAADGEEAAA
jgi:transcriptional regulator with XRE-family HTH domain